MKKILSFLFLFGISVFLGAQDNLDLPFSGDGVLTYGQQVNITSENVTGSVLHPMTGDLYVAGNYTDGTDSYAYLGRFNGFTGAPDPTFGNFGFSVLGGVNDVVINAMDINPAGDIVLAGFRFNSGIKEPWLGIVQSGTDYFQTQNTFSGVNAGSNAEFYTVNFTSSGNVVAAGYARIGAQTQSLVLKANATLQEDLSFNTSISYFLNSDLNSNVITASCIHGDSLFVSGFIDVTQRDTVFVNKYIVEGPGLGLASGYGGGNPVKFYFSLDGDAIPGGITVMPDSKIVLAAAISTSGAHQLGMLRINTDGTLDNGFGGSGYTEFGWGTDLTVRDIQYNSAYDRLVLTGLRSASGNSTAFGLTYNNDGTTQIAQSLIDISGSSSESGESIVYNPNTTAFYISGGSFSNNTDILLIKCDVNFTQDVMFGMGGYARYYLKSSEERIFDIESTTDGVYNLVRLTSGPSRKFGIMKFTTSGILDNSFGLSGFAEWNNIDPVDELEVMHRTSGGDIFVAGLTAVPADPQKRQLVLAKYNPDGSLQTSFNGDGITTFSYRDSIQEVLSVIELPSGKIAVAVSYLEADDFRYVAILRFTSNGIIDNTTFAASNGGVCISSFKHSDSKACDLHVDVDPTKIIFVGTNRVSTNSMISAFRVTDIGVIESNFGTAGYFNSDLGAINAIANHSDVDASGNIYISAYKGDEPLFQMVAVKLTNSGQLDNAFGTSGQLVPAVSSSLSAGFDIKVVGSTLYMVGYDEPNLILVKTDLNGAMDTGFGTNGIMTFQSISQETVETLSMDYIGDGVLHFGHTEEDVYGNLDMKIYRFITGPFTGGGGGGTLPTGITLSNVNKVYGDAPFTVTANSASSEPITYSVVSGCLAYDSNLDQFEITCAGTAIIRATQPANSTYEAGSVDATVTIARGTPSIAFNNQGAVVGDVAFKLLFTSNSDTSLAVFSSTTNSAFTVSPKGVVTILAAGSELVTVNIPVTQNYVAVSASATFTVYTNPVPPDVLPTTVNAIIGDTVRIDLKDILVGNSSPVDLTSIDLDPNTAGIQNFFATPSEGFYSVDSNGILTFIPIYGFTGEAALNFLVSDTRGEKSKISRVRFVYELPSKETIPELETKEIFTPNGDGFNDAFVIAFLDNTLTNSLVVYDRNGHEVYKVSDYQNDWVGVDTSGKKLDSGVYYYLFSDELNRVAKGAIVIKH
jgi:gliding motility-associated-like protein/uncharacterized delta-60 repeat protein